MKEAIAKELMDVLSADYVKVVDDSSKHKGPVGVVVDGCPSGLELDVSDIQHDLDRRRPGQSHITTPRDEPDCVEILSGVFEGKTTGTPIAMLVRNKDANSKAYDHLKEVYRPSHADYTYDQKYGFRDWKGGGRSSARETIGRVASGAIARKILEKSAGITILSYVRSIHLLTGNIDVATLDQNIMMLYMWIKVK